MADHQDRYADLIAAEIDNFRNRPVDDPLRQLHRLKAVRGMVEQGLPQFRSEKRAQLRAKAAEICAPVMHSVEGAAAHDALLTAIDSGQSPSLETALARVVSLVAASTDRAGVVRALASLASVERAFQDQSCAMIDARDRANVDHQQNGGEADADVAGMLTRYLRATFVDEPVIEVSHVHRVIGGFSKETLILTLSHNRSLPDAMVVRHQRDAGMKKVSVSLADEWELLTALHAAGVQVPLPLAFESNGTVLGGPFIVMEKMTGRNVGDGFDLLQPQPGLGIDLAQALSGLHQVPLDAMPAKLSGREGAVRDHVRAEVEEYEQVWRALERPSALVEAAFALLHAQLPHLAETKVLIHSDLGFHNFLVENARISALLDWENASVGHPGRDLGYLWHVVIQLCDWDQFLQAYEAAGAAPVHKEDLDFFILWASVWRTVQTLRVQAAFEQGQLEGLQWGFIASYLVQRELQMLALKLDNILSAGD